jgi:DNA-binding LytR/AlgR family response regulator
MKKLEDNLPDYFVRIHRSYIVNIRKVDKVESNNLLIGSITLPVSSSYKQALLDKLNLMM